MKIKLDESPGRRGAEIFRIAGHDVEIVASERLSGATDRDLIEVCRREDRCLVTLDLDFSNPLVFRPSDSIKKETGADVILSLAPYPCWS